MYDPIYLGGSDLVPHSECGPIPFVHLAAHSKAKVQASESSGPKLHDEHKVFLPTIPLSLSATSTMSIEHLQGKASSRTWKRRARLDALQSTVATSAVGNEAKRKMETLAAPFLSGCEGMVKKLKQEITGITKLASAEAVP